MAQKKRKKYSGMGDSILNREYHSRSYHKFFEDYVETVQTGRNRTQKIVRMYIGGYYRNDLTKRQNVRLKISYTVLFAIAAMFYIMAGVMPLASNLKWYVALPEALNLVIMLCLLKNLIGYLTAKTKMTIGEYRSTSKALQRTSAAAAISFVLTVLCLLVSLIAAEFSDNGKTVIACMAEIAVCGLCMLAIFRLEKKLNYTKIPNKVEAPDHASYL